MLLETCNVFDWKADDIFFCIVCNSMMQEAPKSINILHLKLFLFLNFEFSFNVEGFKGFN